MSIQRVNCLHAAATGYAPLIFTKAVKGCRDLLRQCKLVFANVKQDSNLSKKLVCQTVSFLRKHLLFKKGVVVGWISITPTQFL
jgi:hypothetical protein